MSSLYKYILFGIMQCIPQQLTLAYLIINYCLGIYYYIKSMDEHLGPGIKSIVYKILFD